MGSGKLGHPEGEVALTRAAGKHDIIQMVRDFLPSRKARNRS